MTGLDWSIPERVVRNSDLYRDPEFNKIPSMISAQAEGDVAKFQKQQLKLSNYPVLSVKGSLSQAVNGRNPNNNEDDGLYDSIMLEASSNLYQGGAIKSQTRAASYAEEAAKAKVNSVYLSVLDEVRLLREEIENKQRLMSILIARKETTIRTRELYQEQYKLGTRSAVDLLNAEHSIHSAAQEIENARYDIYEPTASIDDVSEKQLIDHLKLWLGQSTMIVATHRRAVLELVDRIIVVNDGKIV